MAYRTVGFNWLPRGNRQWQTFTSARQEAARLWNDLVVRHQRIRRLHWTWPSKRRSLGETPLSGAALAVGAADYWRV